MNNDEELEDALTKLLLELGTRGIVTMLGLRETVGSGSTPWPSAKVLLDGFNAMNTTKVDETKKNKTVSKLTVGAKALMKHCHRSSDGFWGSGKGTEAQKNERAETICRKILKDSIWINIHVFAGATEVIECRQQ